MAKLNLQHKVVHKRGRSQEQFTLHLKGRMTDPIARFINTGGFKRKSAGTYIARFGVDEEICSDPDVADAIQARRLANTSEKSDRKMCRQWLADITSEIGVEDPHWLISDMHTFAHVKSAHIGRTDFDREYARMRYQRSSRDG